MKTVGDLKDSIAGLLTGTNLDNVTGLDGAIERAARTLIQRVFIPEATAKDSITLYAGVTDYTVNPQIFGGTLNDLRPQGISRTPIDYVYKKPIEQFDRTKDLLPNGYMVTFEWDKGRPILRVSQNKSTAQVILDSMSITTGWAAGGTASGLILDSSFFYQTPGSLRFNVSSGAGYIEKTLSSSINLSSYKSVGKVFLAIYAPDVTNLTSIDLRIGSSSSAWEHMTVTTGFLGAWRSGEWLLVPFDLSLALASGGLGGSPDYSAINYFRITVNATGTLTNFRVGYLFTALPSSHELLYSTAAIFLSSDELSNEIKDDNDEIVLSDPAYTLLEHEAALAVALQQGGSLSTGFASTINQILNGARARNGAVIQLGLYDLYRAENPSEKIESVGNWYND